MEDVSRELHYESILNATVYDSQENLVKTNGNLIFFDCNLRKVNQVSKGRALFYNLCLFTVVD